MIEYITYLLLCYPGQGVQGWGGRKIQAMDRDFFFLALQSEAEAGIIYNPGLQTAFAATTLNPELLKTYLGKNSLDRVGYRVPVRACAQMRQGKGRVETKYLRSGEFGPAIRLRCGDMLMYHTLASYPTDTKEHIQSN